MSSGPEWLEMQRIPFLNGDISDYDHKTHDTRSDNEMVSKIPVDTQRAFWVSLI